MTSYRVVAPVFLLRFQDADGVFFRAYSPRQYGPAYTYDIIIEGEDNQHPMMNMEYMDTLQRILSGIDMEHESESFVDMTTDFHCPVPLEERGDVLYVITLRDSPFSPVFFLKQDAELYLEYLRQVFVDLRSHLRLQEPGHAML